MKKINKTQNIYINKQLAETSKTAQNLKTIKKTKIKKKSGNRNSS